MEESRGAEGAEVGSGGWEVGPTEEAGELVDDGAADVDLED